MPVIDPAESKQRVRSTALWAGLGAVIMIFFGYQEWSFPDENPMRTGAYVFVYTLKVGGIVMLVEAVWLWSGARAALVCDGMVTMAIGTLLVLGGLLLTPGRIVQAVLFILFGMLFLHTGLRSWRDARALLPDSAETDQDVPSETAPPEADPADE